MYKITFLVIGLLFSLAGCVVIDESGFEGAQPEGDFGPASLSGMWAGESNWDGAIKEIRVLVRKPVIERMVTPTPQAPLKKTESVPPKRDESGISSPALTLNPSSKPGDKKPAQVVSPTPQAPAQVWEQVTDPGLVFWGWDIFFGGAEKINYVNVQIIFKEDGPGKMTVVSQTGGSGNARFIQDGSERYIELALMHPIFKEIKGRFLFAGDKINGSFTFLGKEGIFKLTKDNSKPAENQPR